MDASAMVKWLNEVMEGQPIAKQRRFSLRVAFEVLRRAVEQQQVQPEVTHDVFSAIMDAACVDAQIELAEHLFGVFQNAEVIASKLPSEVVVALLHEEGVKTALRYRERLVNLLEIVRPGFGKEQKEMGK